MATIQVTAESDRMTVAEMITLGKDLEQAVKDGFDPEHPVTFVVGWATRMVRQVTVTGTLPEPAPKKAAKKAPAKKATAAQ
jgi:hypothetical protein